MKTQYFTGLKNFPKYDVRHIGSIFIRHQWEDRYLVFYEGYWHKNPIKDLRDYTECCEKIDLEQMVKGRGLGCLRV